MRGAEGGPGARCAAAGWLGGGPAEGVAPSLAKGDRRATWAWHDGDDLGKTAMAIIAKEFGYTLEEVRRL